MEVIHIKSSPGKSVLLAIVVFPIVALFVGCSIGLTYGVSTEGWGKNAPEGIELWGWLIIAGLWLLTIVIIYQWWRIFVWQLIDSKPRLILDSQGFTDKLLGVGCIEWDDVSDVVLVINGFNRFIDLHVSNRDTYVERKGAIPALLYKVTHFFSSDKFRLYGNNFDRSAEEVANTILQYRNACLAAKS
jgi:hypothetical protein